MSNRRALLLAVALVGLAYTGVRNLPDLFPAPLTFVDHSAMPGFRTVTEGDATSSGINPLFGIDGPREPPAGFEQIVQDVRSDPCGALFGDLARQDQILPIASFSDYYCPFCRVQTVKLGATEAETEGRVAVVWHELPLLGDTSRLAAKAALAAKRQGGYVRFHEQLLQTSFGATDAYIASLADKLGLDADQLIRDMKSDDVERELQRSAALAQVFRFIGTPSMVIGRTVVEGTISDNHLAALIEDELDRLGAGWCGRE